MIPGSGRSPGGGNGNSLQYSCLENLMDSLNHYTCLITELELGPFILPEICYLLLLLLLLSRFSYDSVRPHRQQPTRLPQRWDSPGKTTGVGCHFLLQCMKVKSESEVAQSTQTLSDPMDWSLLGSSVHGIFQARVLAWVAIAFSKYVDERFAIKLLD